MHALFSMRKLEWIEVKSNVFSNDEWNVCFSFIRS